MLKRKIVHVQQDGGGDFTTIKEAVQMIPKEGNITIIIHEGIYREEIVIPNGGRDENSRVILQAAAGEKPVITGAEKVRNELWRETAEEGIYEIRMEKKYFQENTEGRYFNPFAVRWMSKGFSAEHKNFFTCGCVYLNDIEMSQCWSMEELREGGMKWFAKVDTETGETVVYANFGNENPLETKNQIEINYRMQCITAKWNQGYITLSGLKVIRGCGPKTIDFWMTNAEAMYGAIATNGGHHWVIENCEVTGCRGVAIDYGSGSAKQELRYGGEPKLYGFHIIRNNYIHENGTNGIMAYRGAYTEIYNNRLINNNTLNTGLLSEAYIKDVCGGWGINIHDNYLYSDQEWNAYPIWMDSECDMCRISRNIIYCKGNGKGFTGLDFECNSGWTLIDNNIFVGVGHKLFSSTSTYLVNNLWIDMPEGFCSWPSTYSSGLMGTEGWDGYSRAMRIAKPGTLSVIGKDLTSRWQTFNNQNKMLGNVFVGQGMTTVSGEMNVSDEQKNDEGIAEDRQKKDLSRIRICLDGPAKEKEPQVNGTYCEMVLNQEKDEKTGEYIANPDYSYGTWKASLPEATPEEKAAARYLGISAWIPATTEDEQLYQKQIHSKQSGGLDSFETYGNECDYNGYMCGAKMLDDPNYAAARGYVAEAHSAFAEDGICEVTATQDTFTLRFKMDQSLWEIEMPTATGELLGASPCYEQAFDRYFPDECKDILLPENVDIDYFGQKRDRQKTTIGPFLRTEDDRYVCWPKNSCFTEEK